MEQRCRRIVLSRESPLPLYRQLSQGLEALITAGTFAEGDRLPNVEDLSRLLGVSKSTVVQAVGELQRRGLLTSRRAKGMHVAALHQKTTELLLCAIDPSHRMLSDLVSQMVEGLVAGDHDPLRRIVSTFAQDDILDAQELLAIAEVRRTDGAVVYRPGPGTHAALRALAERIPCVSLMIPVPDAPVDCLVFDVERAIRALLDRRVKAGVRAVVYAGHLSILTAQGVGPYCPYARMFEAMQRHLAAARVPLDLVVSPALRGHQSASELDEVLVGLAATRIPPGSVVVAQTGTIARRLAELDRGFDLITYTEGRTTLNACRDTMSVVYGGLEMLGQAAARLLCQRRGVPAPREAQVVRVKPIITGITPPVPPTPSTTTSRKRS